LSGLQSSPLLYLVTQKGVFPRFSLSAPLGHCLVNTNFWLVRYAWKIGLHPTGGGPPRCSPPPHQI